MRKRCEETAARRALPADSSSPRKWHAGLMAEGAKAAHIFSLLFFAA